MMKFSRILFLVLVMLSILGSSFAYASNTDDKYKENAIEALTYLLATTENIQATQIKKIYDCGWHDFVFVFSGNNAESYRVTKEGDESNWEYSIISGFSGRIVNGKNLILFDEWDSGDVNWLISQMTSSTNKDESTVDNSVEDIISEYTILQKGSKGDEVIKLQNRLNELGYSVGKADGDFGNKTKTAIEQFQKDNGLEVTGIADARTQELLFSNSGSKESVADVNEGSKTDADTYKLQAIATGIDYITDFALETAPPVFSAFGSTDSCRVTEIYCKEKGDDVYQFTAKVKSGSSTIGFGEDLKITNSNGKWNIEEVSSLNMYMSAGLNNIPGELVWKSSDNGYDALMDAFRELGDAVDTDGDGHISFDEIF